jgi:predicted  nucleic acid-binding Zn-ribbon protein
MNPEIEKLVHLQSAESRLRRVETEVADVPKRRAQLDEALAAERARLENARGLLATSQKTRRQLESELQDQETKRSRYKAQLMEVKTNKEYTAMLHEIEAVEREIRAREDRVLEEMERAESLQAAVKAEELALKEGAERHRVESQALDQRAAQLAHEAEQLSSERDAVAVTLAETSRDLFRRLAKLRGVALAGATSDETCGMCHVKLPPQMALDARKNEAILQCPACQRILYCEPPPPTTDVQP